MSTELATSSGINIAEIIVRGNLAQLTEKQKVEYYLAVCQACGLNPATRPFEFIQMKGKLILYALKSCTEQLRKRDEVTVSIVNQETIDGVYVVRVKASVPSGRSDEDLAAVVLGTAQGEDRANLIMKTITKAKRRATLSLCGLGMLDETEVESVVQQTAPQQVQVVTSQPVAETNHTTEDTVTTERLQVEADCLARAKRLGIADKFEKHLKNAYGQAYIGLLNTDQIADLQRRLTKKELETQKVLA
jgi:hypothetical protein